MNTLTGYSKNKLSDNYVLTASGGHRAIGNADGNIPLSNGTVNTNLDADKLDGYHLTDIIPSGYITSGTASLSSYWGKLWDYTQTNNDNSDITFYIHSAYGQERGFVHINLRRNSSTTDGTTTYTMQVNMHQITGNIPTTDLRLYYNTSGLVQLWANCGARWGVYNCKLISCTSRTGKEGKLKGTIYATNFTAAQTLPTDSYIELSNVPAATANSATSASQIPVTQHTTNNTEYPLVWSNQNNTNSSTANQLYKSYSDLIYNPANKRITIKGLVETPKVQNASGILTLNGQTNIYLKINNTDSSSINLASTYFKPFGSAKNLIDLGTSDSRWKGVYANTGDFTGDVLSGTKFKASNSNGSISVYTSTNRGLYDETNSAWIVYLLKDASHVYIPKWASKGSSTQPVYFNGSGEPIACTAYSGLLTALSSTSATNLSITVGGTTKTINDLWATDLANKYSSRPTTIAPGITGDGGMFQFKCTSSVTDTATDPGDGHILHFNWDNTGGYDAQLFLPTSSSALKVRGMNGGTWQSWATVLTNVNSSVSGGGSTWGSSITVNLGGTSKTLTIPSKPALSVTTSGSGNAVTDVTVSDHALTLKKDASFASGQNTSYKATGTAAARWVRIASTSAYTAFGIISICNSYNNNATASVTFVFNTGYVNSSNPSITQIGGSRGVFTKARIVRGNTSATAKTAYIEVYYNTTSVGNTLYINIANARNTTLYTEYTEGSIPTDYVTFERDFLADGFAGNGYYKQGSSDSYVLLGGGGHKTISSFQDTYDGRYVKKSGDTITGTLTIKRNASAIRYTNTDDTVWGWIGFNAKDTPVVYMGDSSTVYNLLHSGNSSVSGGGSAAGSSLTVKINGTSKTLTIPSSLPASGGTADYSNYLKVLDVRGTNHLPNSTTYPEKNITAFFNNTGTPDSSWWSGITVKGWTNSYAVWQLCSYSSTGTANDYNLYFRNGINDGWGSWKTIITSSNITGYYWANVKISSSSSTTTTPTFAKVSISNSAYNLMTLTRSGSANGALIAFANSNGTLGHIGMTGAANGGLYRYSADANSSYLVCDANNSSVSGGGSTWGSSITVKIAGTSKTLTIPSAPTSVSGNAGSATKVYINNSSSDGVYPVTFTNTAACGTPRNDSLYVDTASGAGYNPSTNAFVGSIMTAGTHNSTSTLYLNAASEKSILFKIGDTEVARFLQPSGYLGLNTTSPTYRLHVSGTGYFTNGIRANDKAIIDSTGRFIPASTSVRNAGVYGVYDSTKVGHVWSMGTSYAIPADGSNTGNIYGLIYFHTNWSNDSTKNDASKTKVSAYASGHQIGMVSNGSITASLGTYIWARSGFKKDGSSDSYVLLGGGGHKAISDFWTGTRYWANVAVSTSSSTTTSPTFATATATTQVTTPLVHSSARLTLNATSTGVDLKFNNDNTKSVILNGTAFKPFGDANGNLDLGTSSARWKCVYSGTGSYTGEVVSGSYFKAENSNGAVSILASTNRGLYDSTNSAWIIYLLKDASKVYVPKWASKGSATQPVYFNSSGEPVACTAITNYYWANVKVSSSSSTTTAPTFASVTLGTSSAAGNIYMKRDSANYINCGTTEGSGYLAIVAGGKSNSAANSSLSINATSVYPGTTNTISLGTSSNKWSVVYANKWGTSTLGGTAKPIYLNAGTFTECSSTVGSNMLPTYMNAGTITACKYGFKGARYMPVVIASGYIYRSSYTSSTWTFYGAYCEGLTGAITTSVSGGVLQVTFTKASGCNVYIYGCCANMRTSGIVTSYYGTAYEDRSNGMYWLGASSADSNTIYIRAMCQGDENNDTGLSKAEAWNANGNEHGILSFSVVVIGYWT